MSNRNLYLMRVMLTALTGALGLSAAPLQAQLTDLSSTPLSSSANLSVLPNLLFTLDGSGSMSFDYVTDNVGVYDSLDNTTNYMCKTDANGNNACMRMDPPFSATQVNGVGYNPAQQARLFQVFGRLHSAKEFEGIGMGLALTRKMVSRWEGSISAQAVVDVGCCVEMQFRLA